MVCSKQACKQNLGTHNEEHSEEYNNKKVNKKSDNFVTDSKNSLFKGVEGSRR